MPAKQTAQKTNLASVFALVSGIIQIFSSLVYGAFGIFYFILGLVMVSADPGGFVMLILGVFFLLFAIASIVATILFFIAHRDLKDDARRHSGAVKALIGGILGFSVFGIVAAVLGFKDA